MTRATSIQTLVSQAFTQTLIFWWKHLEYRRFISLLPPRLDTVFTRNVDISAGCPYLRSLLAVPAEGENVGAGAELGRHLHLVHHREQEQREPGERGVGPKPVQAWAQRIVKVSVDEMCI